MKTKLDKRIKKENEKLRIHGVSFKRYMENDIMRHSIELHLKGEIPAIGLGSKKIIKLLKEYG